jgi:hypothetical protein
MADLQHTSFWMTLTGGKCLINLIGNLLTIGEALRSFRHLPGYVDFPRAGALNSGRVTTRKL